MAKGPTPTDPMVVYNVIVELERARLDRIARECKVCRRTASTAIRKLAVRGLIQKSGHFWLLTAKQEVGKVEHSGQSTELSPAETAPLEVGKVEHNTTKWDIVGKNHVVVIHGSENQDARMEVNTPVKNWNPKDSVALAALSGAASATASLDGEPSMIEVMQFILTYVANLRSKHNQQEGLKKSRDKNYQFKKFTPKEKIESMRDLVLSLSGAVAQNTLQRDMSWISKSMDLLVPDWSKPKCLVWAKNKMREAREANMVAEIPPAVDEPEEDDDAAAEREWREASEAQDPTACGTYPGTKVDIPAPTVEEPVAPPQSAPLTEQITWHIRHGVRDLPVLAKVCGRDYDAVCRAVTTLELKGIIHMVDGGWEMAA